VGRRPRVRRRRGAAGIGACRGRRRTQPPRCGPRTVPPMPAIAAFGSDPPGPGDRRTASQKPTPDVTSKAPLSQLSGNRRSSLSRGDTTRRSLMALVMARPTSTSPPLAECRSRCVSAPPVGGQAVASRENPAGAANRLVSPGVAVCL
jgi:hypothetical protein